MKYSLLLLLLVTFSGCKETKDDSLTNFKAFVYEVRRESHTYTELEWKETNRNFNRFIHTLNGKFSKQLTDFDRVEINKLKGRYAALRIKGEAKRIEKEHREFLRQQSFATVNDIKPGG